MTSKTLAACLALLSAGLLHTLSAQAADTTRPKIPAYQIEEKNLQVGDPAPERFLTGDLPQLDWQKNGLTYPGAHSRWFMIQDRYALVDLNTGLITQIKPIPQ